MSRSLRTSKAQETKPPRVLRSTAKRVSEVPEGVETASEGAETVSRNVLQDSPVERKPRLSSARVRARESIARARESKARESMTRARESETGASLGSARQGKPVPRRSSGRGTSTVPGHSPGLGTPPVPGHSPGLGTPPVPAPVSRSRIPSILTPRASLSPNLGDARIADDEDAVTTDSDSDSDAFVDVEQEIDVGEEDQKPTVPRPSMQETGAQRRHSEQAKEATTPGGMPDPSAPPPASVPLTAQDILNSAKLSSTLNYHQAQAAHVPNTPRLVIHQIVLENFKSYKGKGVIGPFHKSFSAIVGPNGSGKSNTIDALLFVFGWRAKSMRQGKLSELIHNSAPSALADRSNEGGAGGDEGDYDPAGAGTRKKGAAAFLSAFDSCTVEVWFKEILDIDEDNYKEVPNSQLVVSRTAFRNNSSKYTINGKLATFTEVTTLLKGKGIDLDHKRFLILQGEVESIAQMKPKAQTEHEEGLLEYLEDIIGSSVYKTRIEEANAEVERLNEQRQVQLNRVKIVEREKTSLQGRKAEADAYIRSSNALASMRNRLYQTAAAEARARLSEAQTTLSEATETLSAETTAQEGERNKAEALQSEYDARHAHFKEASASFATLSKELAGLDKAHIQGEEKRKAVAAKVKKLVKTLSDARHAKSQAETTEANLASEVESLGTSVGELEASLAEDEAELAKISESLRGKTEVFTAQIEVLQRELQPWQAQLAAKQGEMDLVRNEKELIEERATAAASAVADAENLAKSLKKELHAKNSTYQSLGAEADALQGASEEAQRRFDDAQRTHSELRDALGGIRARLEDSRASQSSRKAQSAILEGLSRLAAQGRLRGFLGRLGDLGSIDAMYDVAISTACPGLDNLVAETIGDGQAVIEHLRKNNLGRANVMCLDKIGDKGSGGSQGKFPAPRLYDLVRLKEPRFGPVFFQLLSNTLVARDLDEGKAIAYGSRDGRRYRVVTLDGQLIDTSGTMSGGGGRPQRGKMSAKLTDDVTPAVLAKLEKEFDAAQKACDAAEAERDELEKQVVRLKERAPEIDTEMSKLEMEIKSGMSRREEAKKRVAELSTLSQPSPAETQKLSSLSTSLAALSAEFDELTRSKSEIDAKIARLQDEILQVGGVRLRTQRARVDDLRARIEHAHARRVKAEVGQKRAEGEAKKLQKSIEADEKSLLALEASLEDHAKGQAGAESEVRGLRERVEAAERELAGEQKELEALKDALDERLGFMTQFKKREHELQQAISRAKKEVAEESARVGHWEQKRSALSLIDGAEEEEDGVERDQAEGYDEGVGDGDGIEDNAHSPSTLRDYSPEELAETDTKSLKNEIAALETELEKTNLDLSVIEEFNRRQREFLERARDLERVTRERDEGKQRAEELRNKRLSEFMLGFGVISLKLKEMYQMITLGGNAELELVDSLDPFSEGIIFSVMPPKKSWKNISNLSGGEKTLSSLALVFALHAFKPTPLYFMDEIDAALDFRNVSIVANYIKERTKNAQFVVISLRNDMFEASKRLVGIYKVNNATRSIAIDNTKLPLGQDS